MFVKLTTRVICWYGTKPILGLRLYVRLPALVRHGLVVVRLLRRHDRPDGKCWDWVQPVDGEYEDYGADAVEASMTMKLSAPESIGEPLEEVVGVAPGRRLRAVSTTELEQGRRAAHDDDLTITVTADLDADVDLITAAVTFDARRRRRRRRVAEREGRRR